MNDQLDIQQHEGHYHTIALQRHVNAPVGEVWGAWADADRLSHWFTSNAEHDFRVGGRYHNSDGDEGEYLEIVPQSRLKFTWEQPDYSPGSIVTIDIVAVDEGQSLVRLTHERIDCDDEEDLRLGWNWAVDSLARYMETGLGLRFEEWAVMRGIT